MVAPLVQRNAGAARARGLPPLWIGDLSQPRGGPMPFGHASHQTGLDVDVWLDLSPKAWSDHACRIAGRDLTPREWREAVPEQAHRRVCG